LKSTRETQTLRRGDADSRTEQLGVTERARAAAKEIEMFVFNRRLWAESDIANVTAIITAHMIASTEQ